MRSVTITAYRLSAEGARPLLVFAFADTPMYRRLGDQEFFSDGEFLELLERLGVAPEVAAGYLGHTVQVLRRVPIQLQLNDEQFAYLRIQFPEVDA